MCHTHTRTHAHTTASSVSGLGLHVSVEAAVEAMVHVERVVEPDALLHLQYQEHYEAYCQMFEAVKPVTRRRRAA